MDFHPHIYGPKYKLWMPIYGQLDPHDNDHMGFTGQKWQEYGISDFIIIFPAPQKNNIFLMIWPAKNGHISISIYI